MMWGIIHMSFKPRTLQRNSSKPLWANSTVWLKNVTLFTILIGRGFSLRFFPVRKCTNVYGNCNETVLKSCWVWIWSRLQSHSQTHETYHTFMVKITVRPIKYAFVIPSVWRYHKDILLDHVKDNVRGKKKKKHHKKTHFHTRFHK